MILVNVRCERCWSVLHRVDTRPARVDEAPLTVWKCGRCYATDVPFIRALPAPVAVEEGLAFEVPWVDLLPAIEWAERVGAAQDYAPNQGSD